MAQTSINLNELPDELPGSSPVFPKGKYKVTIEKASMTNPKDATKKPYLTVQYSVTDPETNMPVAKFWDKFFDSDNQYVRFKLKKFITALALPIPPDTDFTLSDLTKILSQKIGTSFYADFGVNDKDDKADKPEMQIDLFTGQVYYPGDKAAKAKPQATTTAASETPVLEDEEDDESDY